MFTSIYHHVENEPLARISAEDEDGDIRITVGNVMVWLSPAQAGKMHDLMGAALQDQQPRQAHCEWKEDAAMPSYMEMNDEDEEDE